MARTAPPPGESHQQHQYGIALALDRKTDRIGAAKGQERCDRCHLDPGNHRAQGNRLTDHHQATGQVRQPGQQAQADRTLADQMPPEPQQGVIGRGMGVLPQHRQQATEAGLKTLADAVELIAPQRRGIDQQQGTQPESQANGQRQKQPAAFHRLRSWAALRCRRNSTPIAGPGCHPAAIRSRAVCCA